MMTMSAKVEVPHGVVFLYDPSTIIDVPDDTSAAPVTMTHNCVSLWTIGQYDGPVVLTISTDEKYADNVKIFHGSLETLGKSLAFMNSSCEEIVKVRVSDTISSIRIFANHHEYPDRLSCIINDADKNLIGRDEF